MDTAQEVRKKCLKKINFAHNLKILRWEKC